MLFRSTIQDLELNACKYWPNEISKKVANKSSLMPLLKTQDDFINILKVSNKDEMSWKTVLNQNEKLTANLFLKHLMVLSDVGGERLQRFGRDILEIFPQKLMTFKFKNQITEYKLKSIDGKYAQWNNKKIRVEKKFLVEGGEDFTNEMLDVCMLLLYGAEIFDENSRVPEEIREKCVIGSLMGDNQALETFIRQRYLFVSRQTSGSSANDLGYACEAHVKDKLAKALGNDYFLSGHTLDGVSQNDKTLLKFDMVVANKKTKKSVGIEISFQVTTNSVIERKSQNAKNRRDLAHKYGHKVAYIIDGAGNFQRKSAVEAIMRHSDCTVNFSDAGINELSVFIKNHTR